MGLQIRCIYRISTKANGFDSSAATNEGVLYMFDAIQIGQVGAFFVVFWPGRFMGPELFVTSEPMSLTKYGDSSIPLTAV